MTSIDELKQVNFTTHLKTVLLAKRRANTTLSDYSIRKQRQEQSTATLNDKSICYICKSYYVNFVTTTCEHCFCEKCLFDHLLVCHKRCPQCKQVFKGISTQTLNIDYQLSKALKDDKEYQQRVKEVEDWRNTLSIQELKPQMSLDVLDTEHIWCEGVVKQVYYNKQGKVKSLLIHYEGWNTVYDEMISIKSKRLAPLRTYTAKKGVIQYQASQNETLQRVLNQSTQRYNTTSSVFLLQRLLQRWGSTNHTS